MKMCRALVTHANHSVTFNKKLFECQKRYQSKEHDSQCLTLIQDVPTRWNSTFLMADRILALMPSLKHILVDMTIAGVNFQADDWKLLSQVVEVLRIFHDVTVEMSKVEASISVAIPIVNMILDQLKPSDGKEDHGIKQWKRDLASEVRRMFGERMVGDRSRVGGLNIEQNDIFRLATLLDSQ